MKASVEYVILALNEFKSELERLTLIDIEGGENGPLAMDLTVTRLKSNFKKSLTVKRIRRKRYFLSQLYKNK